MIDACQSCRILENQQQMDITLVTCVQKEEILSDSTMPDIIRWNNQKSWNQKLIFSSTNFRDEMPSLSACSFVMRFDKSGLFNNLSFFFSSMVVDRVLRMKMGTPIRHVLHSLLVSDTAHECHSRRRLINFANASEILLGSQVGIVTFESWESQRIFQLEYTSSTFTSRVVSNRDQYGHLKNHAICRDPFWICRFFLSCQYYLWGDDLSTPVSGNI